MNKLFFFFVLFLYQQSSAQLIIDSLKTAADVESFVKQYGKEHGKDWNYVSVTGCKYCSQYTREEDSLTKVKWIIEDFNNDGRKDLIFNIDIEEDLLPMRFEDDFVFAYQRKIN